ncbi:biotin transporter BioY [Streptomyces exfoliatus]|uniref:biotin transporter BioY n=1 Tax=Streptomyces exfoliatus TaxID=1905 RepID=UPI0004673044|nr:biotin transporter BioY [Streptomyces exfoliatus]
MDLTGGSTLARTPHAPSSDVSSSGISPSRAVPSGAVPSGIAPSRAVPSAVAAVPAVPAVPAVSAGRSAAGVRGGGGRGAARPVVTELRLSAFAGHRGAVHALGPVTLFAGPSGSGKSTTLRAYEALARLGAGDSLDEVFPDAADCVPERARPDAQGRRGFRIGCTVDGPVGPVHLDLAVQAEPRLRIVGERLTRRGRTLLATALRDPGRSTVQAEWHTAGATPVTRAPLPDDLLGTALLPLRVAGKTPGQLEVLAAAEQVVIGLRSAFPCDPRPEGMRAVVLPGEGRLRRDCANLAEVLHRTHTACPRRHHRLATVAGAGCAGPVTGIGVQELPEGFVRAVLERGGRPPTPLGRLGDGELRYLALALTLLTGPGVLAMDRIAEVPDAMQSLTLLADGLDRGLDRRQVRELLGLAVGIAADGHIRVVGAVGEGGEGEARRVPGVTVVDLGE